MKKTLTTLGACLFCSVAFSQQLYLEAFSGLNKTAYDSPLYDNAQNFFSVGARLAAGADHVQVGGEYRTNLTNPTFEVLTIDNEFEESYYGGFLRAKISKYPAMRFGLTLRAGAGIHQVKWVNPAFSYEYDAMLGFNGGAGVSFPAFKAVMLELGYTYNYVERPSVENPFIEKYKANYHTIHVGFSLNFVFGERAKQYNHLRDNWKWRNGWRG
jgi:opacity protein-like surface antigen